MNLPTYSRYITAYGNAGDAVIALATRDLLAKATQTPDGPVVFKGGGLSHHWQLLEPLRALPRETPIVILPSSIDHKVAHVLREFPNLTLHCRGAVSYRIARSHGIHATITEDLAFGLNLKSFKPRGGKGRLVCYRGDVESATNYRPLDVVNDDISAKDCREWTPENCSLPAHAFIHHINEYDEVETDRAHVAIIAALLNKKVLLVGGIDHKIKEIYEHSLVGYSDVEYQAPTWVGPCPKSVIIHQSWKRERYPHELRTRLGNCRIQEAICPSWGASRDNNAIRGCSLSHLAAVRNYGDPNRPLLVLEDDALIRETSYRGWLELNYDDIPADCGAILLGGDIKKYTPTKHTRWYEVEDFAGTQAVVYNLPRLDGTPWLIHAYEHLASHQMGPTGPEKDTGYEHCLWHAIYKSGLKVYCREFHPFTTIPNMVSTRSGLIMHQRSISIHHKPNEN